MLFPSNPGRVGKALSGGFSSWLLALPIASCDDDDDDALGVAGTLHTCRCELMTDARDQLQTTQRYDDLSSGVGERPCIKTTMPSR